MKRRLDEKGKGKLTSLVSADFCQSKLGEGEANKLGEGKYTQLVEGER